MKALIKKNKEPGITLEEIPYPKINKSGVIAKVIYAGICGSDLDIIEGRNKFFEPPVILGHEFCGEIIQIGSDVKNFKKGDKIVSELYFSTCGKCSHCLKGDYYLCSKRKALGWHRGANGAFAEYIYIPEKCIHKIGSKVSNKAAALMEPFAVCIEALINNFANIYLSKDKKITSSLVSGPGPLGIISAQILKKLISKEVFFIGKDSSEPVRFKIAHKIGIKNTLNIYKEDAIKYIMSKTQNEGVDLAVEAAGNVNSFELCTKTVKNNGTICEIGTINSKDLFPWETLCSKNSNIIFSIAASTQSWNTAIELLEKNKISLEPLVTHVFKLEEWKEAFEVAKNSRKSLKVLFEF